MWVADPDGKKMEMEDIVRCRMFFPLFSEDFNILFSAGIIKRLAFDNYDWTKSKTSLAEYFRWIGNDVSDVEGGFWAPIAKVFTVKGKPVTQRQLSKLAGSNANVLKPEKSEDFKKIEGLVLQYRKEKAEQAKLQNDFQTIKKLIEESCHEDIETLRITRDKIKAILT